MIFFYDYDGVISWNDSTIANKQRSPNSYHAESGPLLGNERELLVTFSMKINDALSETQVGLMVMDDQKL